MSKRLILLVVLTIVSGLILCGCAFAPYAKINELQRNMTEQEVINLLGQPSRVEMVYKSSHIIKVFYYHYDDADYFLGFGDNKLGVWGTPMMLDAALSNVNSSAGDYTVYITNTGEKYHRDGCRYLARSKIPIKKSDAIKQGYTPCSVCNP